MKNIWPRKAILVAAIALPALVLADHADPKVKVDLDDGGYRESKSFKSNWLVYRSIGGNTTIKGKEKKRKWYCVWLCKVRVDKKAESITITNYYYSEVSPGVFVSSGPIPKTCEDTASCTLKESAGGFNIDMQFPNGENGGGLLPIDGVVSVHRMVIDGQQYSAFTAKGKHPVPDTPVIE
ncbi:MAG: hypothetical protein AAGM16_14215 [Pseudomonadota bacterium]